MEIIPVKTRLFREGEPLVPFVREFIPRLEPGDLLVVTSKIVALSQGRVLKNGFDKKQIIASESDEVIETPWCDLARRGRDWRANAGVDESNADGTLILLPSQPKETAVALRQEIAEAYGIPEIAIIMTDTRIVPLRQGTMGMALAFAGFDPIQDYVGKPDLFGRPLKMTKANIAHALAAAAVFVMGEGAESIPLAIIRDSGIHINAESAGDAGDLTIAPEEDVYRFVYET